MIDIKKLGRRISYLRHRANLTQNEVSKRCFVSVQAVSKWERGLCCPDLLILDELAAALGVEINELFEEDMEDTETENKEDGGK